MWWERREAAEHHLHHQLHTCYKAVECSKEKYSVNGRSSHPDMFYKKLLLKVLQFTQKNVCAGVSWIRLLVFSLQFYEKKTLTPAFNFCEFCSFLRFFKNISGQMLLEKHWISLKTVPRAITINVSNTG